MFKFTSKKFHNFFYNLKNTYLNEKIAPEIMVLNMNGLASQNQVLKMANHASVPNSCHLGMYHTLEEGYIACGFWLGCKVKGKIIQCCVKRACLLSSLIATKGI